jgi:hypothetical protein
MKNLILALLSPFLIGTALCQNGGQAPENNSVKLEYAGNISGIYYVKVTNKQSCESEIKVNDGQTESTITVSGNGTYMFPLPAGITGNLKVKAKNTTACNNTDYGWIELSLVGLPVKFVSFNTTRISDTEFWVNFEIAEATNVKHFNIKASTDGKIFKTIAIVFPDELQPNRKYSVKINLATSKN